MGQDTSSAFTETEEMLIKRAQKGVTVSFDRLVDGHYSTVYNMAYRMLNESQSAADATQVAFVKAFEALPSFRGDSAFRTWLYRIVVNVCLDEIRRRENQPLSLTTEDEEGEAPLSEREVPDQSEEPAGLAEQRERQETVHRALARLPEDFRAIIVLYDLNGLSYQEISEALQIPLGTVKSRLNRARHALREELEPHLELFR